MINLHKHCFWSSKREDNLLHMAKIARQQTLPIVLVSVAYWGWKTNPLTKLQFEGQIFCHVSGTAHHLTNTLIQDELGGRPHSINRLYPTSMPSFLTMDIEGYGKKIHTGFS